jgi:hypothetical protein
VNAKHILSNTQIHPPGVDRVGCTRTLFSAPAPRVHTLQCTQGAPEVVKGRKFRPAIRALNKENVRSTLSRSTYHPLAGQYAEREGAFNFKPRKRPFDFEVILCTMMIHLNQYNVYKTILMLLA